jgi:hypothetical protein
VIGRRTTRRLRSAAVTMRRRSRWLRYPTDTSGQWSIVYVLDAEVARVRSCVVALITRDQPVYLGRRSPPRAFYPDLWDLFAAWLAWGTSVGCVLTSYYMSTRVLRQSIEQVDTDKMYDQSPGGFYSRRTAILNVAGGWLCLVGSVFMGIFVAYTGRCVITKKPASSPTSTRAQKPEGEQGYIPPPPHLDRNQHLRCRMLLLPPTRTPSNSCSAYTCCCLEI